MTRYLYKLDKVIINKILLGVCGGIAAYKSAEIVRLLRKKNIEVRVVMTHAAMQFISPLTFQALSANPVCTELLDVEEENAMGHINLARWADIILIAPATANSIAKFSIGLADDLLSTLYLAAECPAYIAPAMNRAMWNKAVTQDNIQRLKNQGVHIIDPTSGEQACGETGLGRMSEASDIVATITQNKTIDTLKGINVLITAGPTQEPLDPVRYISNRSSGKMGYALANIALNAGANVTLVSGPVTLSAANGIDLIQVETAEQMYQAVFSKISEQDLFIATAAVADYTPLNTSKEKIKKQDSSSHIALQKTKDILTDIASSPNRPGFVVGFAAETTHLEHYAKSKLEHKKLDMIAANWVGKTRGGFDSDDNALEVFWKSGQKTLKMTDKKHLAIQLITLISEKMNEKNTT
ncbi:MAG: bifunctional phosphopantothenoylcysteine decarboxylase/phosphopantothenate--cysteine ligase CoaBC [Methylococcales symbiont of Hymedesmia sp. n. MRB-2018]|nr:MAG: bifunctional phosphopantothenoylcysteine decarboxylase/phosphopantothenate--cysteine ligase CoaBC [Methylococcales symbiont of Hymedesmia sp. n. MRB-2018]KAF3984435.1 MAG: bifunctional phosphopantothenoylcysteine decarboxylase/phosphopantothenate--cysteine ligase CoaBC [Methylococcales symbiont of Hymedesmia sp. n. MRB-2018]